MNREQINDSKQASADLWLDVYTNLLTVKSELENVRRLYAEVMVLAPVGGGKSLGATTDTRTE